MNSIVLKPVGAGDAIPIPGDDVVIGRNDVCNVVLKTSSVSGKHARLSVKDGGALLEDLGSTNGTFVNGQRISQPTQLKNGDRVKFDVVEFDVVMPTPDRTQVRSGTVVRPAKTEPAAPPSSPANGSPAASAPAAPSAPPAMSSAPEAASNPPPAPSSPPSPAPGPQPRKAPGAWADPGNRPKSKTMFMSKEDLQNMLGQPALSESNLREPHLQVLAGNSQGKNLPLPGAGENDLWKIGSEVGEGALVLTDAGVSAFHATIERKGNRWRVADQLSANGTYVNGTKVIARYLNSGDVLKFGPVECVFRLPKATQSKQNARRAFWPIALVSFIVTVVLLWLLLR